MTARRPFPVAVSLLALVALVAAILAVAPPEAAHADSHVRVVAPNGNDTNPGTEDAPWATIAHGIVSVQPGQHLLIRGGTYAEDLSRVPFTRHPASASARIRLAAWPGERPVISGQFHIRDAHHWDIDGLTIRWPERPRDPGEPLVKIMGGTDWTFTNNEVSGAVAYAGVYVGVSGDTGPARNWRLTGNCIHTTRSTNTAYATDHNLYIQHGLNGGPGLIEGNLLFGAPDGTNLKLGSGSGSSAPSAANLTVRRNTLFNAAQNLLAEHDVRNVTIEANIFGRITDRPNLLGNVRSNGNHTGSVVARDNVSWLASRFIANTIEGQTTASSQGVVDGGGNRHGLDPRFDGVERCSQFNPQAPEAMAFGHAGTNARVAGASRVETAAALSRAARPSGGAPAAVLARSDAYPDALAGAPLAENLGGPLLLTSRDRLDDVTRDELRRLGVDRVVLLGGENALSARVVSDLRAAGIATVERIAGSDRFDTAGRIAERLGGTAVFLVEGASADPNRGWPDAVSAAGLAALTETPILLTTTDLLPDATIGALQALRPESATVIGGRAAVSDRVMADALAAMPDGATIDRLAGENRFATSAAVAARALEMGASGAGVWVATGGNWPDALAAGPAAAATGGVFVLVDGTDLVRTPESRSFVERNAEPGAALRIAGGPNAVSYLVEGQLLHAIGD